MNIRLKLMGILKDKTPKDGLVELVDKGTIKDALVAMEIDVDSVQVFQVNGQLERDKDRVLSSDDELTVFPPVGGG